MKTIELSDHEIKALIELIHLAIQAKGLDVAEAGVVLAKKLQNASRTDSNPT